MLLAATASSFFINTKKEKKMLPNEIMTHQKGILTAEMLNMSYKWSHTVSKSQTIYIYNYSDTSQNSFILHCHIYIINALPFKQVQ